MCRGVDRKTRALVRPSMDAGVCRDRRGWAAKQLGKGNKRKMVLVMESTKTPSAQNKKVRSARIFCPRLH